MQRVQTGVRMERDLVKVLKGPSIYGLRLTAADSHQLTESRPPARPKTQRARRA